MPIFDIPTTFMATGWQSHVPVQASYCLDLKNATWSAWFVLLSSLFYFSFLLACNIVSCCHGDSNWFLSTVFTGLTKVYTIHPCYSYFCLCRCTTLICKEDFISRRIPCGTSPQLLDSFAAGARLTQKVWSVWVGVERVRRDVWFWESKAE